MSPYIRWHEDGAIAVVLCFVSILLLQFVSLAPGRWAVTAFAVAMLPLLAALVIMIRAARWTRRARARK